MASKNWSSFWGSDHYTGIPLYWSAGTEIAICKAFGEKNTSLILSNDVGGELRHQVLDFYSTLC